ncbi:MAG: MFS transporter [Nocardioidaceae bacterium]
MDPATPGRQPRPGPPSLRLSPGLRRGYALGSVATGAFGTVPGLLLLPYLTDTLGIGAVIAGAIVFVPKAWDVVLNPISGRVSDHSAGRRGSRRPFLIRGGLALAACFALLFAGPGQPTWLAGLWVVVAFLGCATAYSFFQVPYVAMPAELTDDYTERTRLMTWRVGILALAILVSGASAPAIRNTWEGHTGYRAMGVFVALLIAAGTVGSYAGTRSERRSAVRASPGTLRQQLAVVGRARDFRALLSTFVLQALATGAMLAGVDYMARHVLHQESASTFLFACFVAPAMVVTPLWQRLGERTGKKTGYVYASLLLLLGALLLIGSQVAPRGVVYAATALVGVGYAGVQVFPLAMLPDTAAVDAQRSGRNRIGVFTGIWTAGETLGLALGPGLYALVLAAGGYVSSSGGDVTQPASAVTAITLGFSLLPAVLMVLSLLPLRGYRLGESEVRAALATYGDTGSSSGDDDGDEAKGDGDPPPAQSP